MRNRCALAYAEQLGEPRTDVRAGFARYNGGRVHSKVKMTPAVVQGLADREWVLEELLEKGGYHLSGGGQHGGDETLRG